MCQRDSARFCLRTIATSCRAYNYEISLKSSHHRNHANSSVLNRQNWLASLRWWPQQMYQLQSPKVGYRGRPQARWKYIDSMTSFLITFFSRDRVPCEPSIAHTLRMAQMARFDARFFYDLVEVPKYKGSQIPQIANETSPKGILKSKWKCRIASERKEMDKTQSKDHLTKASLRNQMVTSFAVCYVRPLAVEITSGQL